MYWLAVLVCVCVHVWQTLIIILRNFWAALQTKEGKRLGGFGRGSGGRRREYARVEITNYLSFDYSPILPLSFSLSPSPRLRNCRMWSSHSYPVKRDTCCFLQTISSLCAGLFLLPSPSTSSSSCFLCFQIIYFSFPPPPSISSPLSLSRLPSPTSHSPPPPSQYPAVPYLSPHRLIIFLSLPFPSLFFLSSYYPKSPSLSLSSPMFFFFSQMHHGAEYRLDEQPLKMFSCSVIMRESKFPKYALRTLILLFDLILTAVTLRGQDAKRNNDDDNDLHWIYTAGQTLEEPVCADCCFAYYAIFDSSLYWNQIKWLIKMDFPCSTVDFEDTFLYWLPLRGSLHTSTMARHLNSLDPDFFKFFLIKIHELEIMVHIISWKTVQRCKYHPDMWDKADRIRKNTLSP